MPVARESPEAGDPANIAMVDVGGKPVVERVAVARGEIVLQPGTIARVRQGTIEKGNVIAAARLAGIAAAKGTPGLLPLCHPVRLTKVSVDVTVHDDRIVVTSEVKALERTGVEMEALVATTVALLNIWDMTKMHEKDDAGQYPSTAIRDVRVLHKVKGTPGATGGAP